MNNTFYDLIPPIEKIIIQKYVKYAITDIMIKLFNSASMTVNLYDEKNNIIAVEYLEMDEYNYSLWNSDDEFLVQWVNTQLEILFGIK